MRVAPVAVIKSSDGAYTADTLDVDSIINAAWSPVFEPPREQGAP